MSLSLASYSGDHQFLGQPRATAQPVSCLLSRNPPHRQHLPARTKQAGKQADGTAISSSLTSPVTSPYAWLQIQIRLYFDTPEDDHEAAIPTGIASAPPWLQRANGNDVRRPAVQCPVSGRSAAASVTHIPPETAPDFNGTALSVFGSVSRDSTLPCLDSHARQLCLLG